MSTTTALVEDAPSRARSELADALARWNVPDSVHVQHFNALMSEVSIDLYCGEGVRAWERMDGALEPFKSALMLRVQTIRTSALFSRGRAAVAAARAGRPELLRVAAADARALNKEGVAYASTLGTIIAAAVAHARQDLETTAARLREAAQHAEAAEMRLHAESARWELGRLLGGDEGRALVAEAERLVRAEGVRDPAAMIATFTTGITR